MQTNFLKQFLDFIKEKKLFTAEEKILLAVSGGVDSIVLVNLFTEAGFTKNIGIAHCNFGLRGAESEGDEAFVRALAEKLQIPVFVKYFDTKNFASENNISTQMAARELRYNWFEEVRTGHNFKYIATAHHKDDVAETILLNLVKGTVLKGLHGILPKSKNHIIRPLLWAQKEEIMQFANSRNISYREDSSNIENKYQRNLLRNQVMPLLRQINPDLVNTMYQNAEHRLQLEEWLEDKTKILFNELFISTGKTLTCEINALKQSKITEAILYQMLQDFGFSFNQLSKLISVLDETEHKRFISPTHILVKERKAIILLPRELKKTKTMDLEIIISNNRRSAEIGGKRFSISTISPEDVTDLKNPTTAYLDIDKLTQPIKIRSWKAGDYFYPIGMKGKKKLSDFLTDIKASSLEKDDQLVLVSGEEIAWIIGKRTDDRFKISGETKRILKIEIVYPEYQ